MIITKLINLVDDDFDSTVWRYLTFSKFISLITYQALWFSKLNILQDKFEGTLPIRAKIEMHKENKKWKEIFIHPDHQKQLNDIPDRNVKDGRELTVVNCWFLSDSESKKMWDEYVGRSEGVAIKSTIRKLCSHVFVYPEFSQTGKVKYVDFNKHTMSLYEAHQAQERAFLKDERYIHEHEIRIVSMSVKTPMCVKLKGKPMAEEDYTGKNMNNFENPGLYIRIDLKNLIDSIVLAPNATNWFEFLVKRILELFKLNATVDRSKFDSI